MSDTPPMRGLVKMVALACRDWLEVDGLPSPPATAHMLQTTDMNLAQAVENLCRSYPKQMGCERHPGGNAPADVGSVYPKESA